MARYTVTSYPRESEILAAAEGLRMPTHATIDPTQVTPDANGDKLFQGGGYWVGESGNLARILPRANVVTGGTNANGDTTIELDMVQQFVVGDTVYEVTGGSSEDTSDDDAYGNELGTIESIDVPNKTITFDTTIANDIAAGDKAGAQSRPLGLLIDGIHLKDGEGNDAERDRGLAIAASVYRARMPYTDTQLYRWFGGVRLIG